MLLLLIAAAASQPAIVPPRALTSVPASAPAGATVVLRVTVGVDGHVTEPEVIESGGSERDAAALAAIVSWTFEPALKSGVPIAAKIRVPFEFAAPASQPASVPASAPVTEEEEAPLQVNVRGKREHKAQRNVSDFVVERDTLTASVHADAGQMLRTAPGIYVSRPEGDAVAHEIFLRGFDAEHGQDIELTAAGITLNRVSHIHGQGYADLNLVIPEVVRSIRVIEGVYDPRQADFAVAGSVHFDLGVIDRGLRLTSRYGRFNTFRQSVVFAPRGEDEQTFGAASFSRTDGFGDNRGALSGAAIGQYAFKLPAGFSGLVHVAANAARAGSAGVVRSDDVAAGRVGFYDVYDDPSARAQSALSLRAQVLLQIVREVESGARTELAIAFVTTQFSLRSNFTGYTQRSEQRPEWTGRGDLIEQRNVDYTFSGKTSHRFAPFQLASWLQGVFECGASLRVDRVEQTQNLLQQPNNETWDRRVDARVLGTDIGVYGDLNLRFTSWLAVKGGARADVLLYDIDDALGNVTEAFRREEHFAGYRRTALGVAAGPRVSVDVTPLPWLKIVAAYGEGYRSPQARQLDEGESAPFAKVRGAELGVQLEPNDRVTLAAAGFVTFLSNDLAFDAAEGRLERIGPTSRKGAVVRVETRPTSWLFASASVTYVNATLDAPPPPSPEDPTPAYVRGQLLPYVPSVVARVDASVNGTLAHFGDGELTGRFGAGLSVLGPRPLPYGQTSVSFATLDAQASLSWRWITLGIEAQNLTNTRYAATEYVFVSHWPTRDLPSQLPARHTAAGAPLTVQGVLGLTF